MEEKQLKKQIIKQIVQLIIVIMVLLGVFTSVKAVDDDDDRDGKVISDETKAEIFDEYKGPAFDKLNRQEHPVWLFKDFDLSMWCNEHRRDVDGFMTATELHYWADKERPDRVEGGPTAWSKDNPFHWYRRSEDCGLVENLIGGRRYKTLYDEWRDEMLSPKPGWCHPQSATYVTPFQGEEGIWKREGAIGINSNTMPAKPGSDWGTDPLMSIEWNRDEIGALPVPEIQDGLFILTQQLIYEKVEDIPLDCPALTDEQKQNAYFTADEKQAALWELKGFSKWFSIGADNDKEDRNLGLAAKRWQTFYNMIHKDGEDKYEDFVKAMWLDKNNEIQELDDVHVTEIEETELEGESYKTYAYKDSISEVNTNNKSHILGPFVIDYSVLDEAEGDMNCLDATTIKGTGKSTEYGQEYDPSEIINPKDPNRDPSSGTSEDTPPDWLFPEPSKEPEIEYAEIKFDAIEKITVYNQDKKNIEDLGGSFKIAYECKDGDIADEGLERRIIDYDGTYYYEFADGEKVPSFLSRKPFYIVVYRGDMEAKDFTNFYAKIDIQYLESCDGEIYIYNGTVYDYYYDCYEKPYTFNYEARGYMPGTDVFGNHYCDPTTIRQSWTPNTYTWELFKEETNKRPQQFIAFRHRNLRASRNYKKYTIVITSWPEPELPPPELVLLKKCAEGCGPLYGAKFNVDIHITGKDIIFDQDIDKTILTSVTTDPNGKVHIGLDIFEQFGIFVQNLDYASVEIKFVEVQAPANHILDPTPHTITLRLQKGAIIGVFGNGGEQVGVTNDGSDSAYALFELNNHHRRNSKTCNREN